MGKIKVKVKDKVHELEGNVSAFELAQTLHLTAPDQAVAVRIDGRLVDFSTPLKEGQNVEFLNFQDEVGKEVFWHSSAHILAQAILRLWPTAKPTIGPPIENGFYYDFADLHISEEDFPKIEEEMEKIIKENFKTTREVLPSKQAALAAFGQNPYKKELIEGFPDGELTAYRQGEFYDLCRGPHLPFLSKVKAFKVLKTSGAYWRGDASREMLTRVYGITFPDKKLLKEYLHRVEEAKKRDHKVIGPQLDLFSLKEEAPGMPFIHPKGMVMINELLSFWREHHEAAGYVEIKTPLLMAKDLWVRSGHWENYRQNMYTTAIEEKEFAIKPMNCPGCILYYKTGTHSYREFPLRIAEIGHVHRHEATGALSGLMRVRCFHQDDAHLFLEMEQVEAEISNVITLLEVIYGTFGLTFELELSTRPTSGTIGSDEEWEASTAALKNALDKKGEPYKINEGDGAFYGPKIDVHIRDAIGRRWQCCTIQLDMALPARFELEYDAKDGSRKRPIMIHRALFGSIERFFGILIEHFAGKFPLWISPRQVRLIPVADRHIEYAQLVASALRKKKFHVEIDSSHESVGKKIREAQLAQVNYMLTVGDKEMENQTVAVRTRDNVVHGEISISELIKRLEHEREKRSLTSEFTHENHCC
jgi:threonyl-tRNA synthetase